MTVEPNRTNKSPHASLKETGRQIRSAETDCDGNLTLLLIVRPEPE